jgi:hypothetical protein
MTAHACLFRRLHADTVDPRRDHLAAGRVLGWTQDHPALAGCETPAGIVARCLDPADRHAANAAFGALVELAVDDPLARRIALGCLAPGLASLAHRMALRWDADAAELDQGAAAAAWEALGEGWAGARRWAARAVLGRVEGRLRWALAVDSRRRGIGLPHDLVERGPDPLIALEGRLDARRRLDTAVATGTVSDLAARVVWATRVADRPITEVGDALGRSPGSVRVLRARAEAALRAAG